MFGGAGIFADGLMIALVSEGAIYLKADDSTIPQFEREGLKPFTYTAKTRKRAVMSYWRMPERLYDDPGGAGACRGSWQGGGRQAKALAVQATWASPLEANSGSVSLITRLRPLRLAA